MTMFHAINSFEMRMRTNIGIINYFITFMKDNFLKYMLELKYISNCALSFWFKYNRIETLLLVNFNFENLLYLIRLKYRRCDSFKNSQLIG